MKHIVEPQVQQTERFTTRQSQTERVEEVRESGLYPEGCGQKNAKQAETLLQEDTFVSNGERRGGGSPGI